MDKQTSGSEIGSCPTPGCGKLVPLDHPYSWCIHCGERLPEEILARIRRPKIEEKPDRWALPNRARISRRNWYSILGILGLLTVGVSSKEYLKEGQKWPGEMTLGVLAIVIAMQELTGAPRAEIQCSWRIFVTFCGVSIMFSPLGEPESVWNTVFNGAKLLASIYFWYQIWRRPPVET
ncbi:MAG: hypothetical protein ABJC13_09540 [Acidobacteriota bacterium]